MTDNNKPHRNGPCPCGSGRKYKKCCMAKDQAAAKPKTVKAAGKLKNTFREEVAKRPEAEQLLIDQRILLSQLSLQAEMHERDKEHLSGSIVMWKEQIAKLQAMPASEITEGIIASMEHQLKAVGNAIDQSAPTLAQVAYLKTLKQVLRRPLPATGPDPEALEAGKTVPISPAVAATLAKPKPKGDGPIMTDEDDDLDD